MSPKNELSQPKPYSFWGIVKDIGILVFVLLPEGAERVLGCFSDQPPAIWLQEKGLSMSWFLIVTIPVGLLLFFKQHRVKIRTEAGFLFEQFPKNAPLVLFLVALTIFLLVLHGCNQFFENGRLTGMLNIATNPPAILSMPKDQISLTPADAATFAANAKAYAEMFSRTNGAKPYVSLILNATSQKSVHLFRQIKDSLEPDWNVDINSSTMQTSIGNGIWIYDGNPAHPSPQLGFWKTTLLSCSLQFQTGNWGAQIPNDGLVIIINDPQYYY